MRPKDLTDAQRKTIEKNFKFYGDPEIAFNEAGLDPSIFAEWLTKINEDQDCQDFIRKCYQNNCNARKELLDAAITCAHEKSDAKLLVSLSRELSPAGWSDMVEKYTKISGTDITPAQAEKKLESFVVKYKSAIVPILIKHGIVEKNGTIIEDETDDF